MEKTVIGFEADFVYGYVNGDRFMVANTVEQICAFIMKHRLSDVKIVNILDQMEIETSMGIISYCANQEFLRTTLIPALVPMQRGEVEAPEFTVYVPEVDFVVSNVRMKSGAGHYLGSIDFEEGFPQPYDKQSEYFETEEAVETAYPQSISYSEAMNMAYSKGWMETVHLPSDKQAEFDANFVDDDNE